MYRTRDLNTIGNVYNHVICENAAQLPPEIVKAITELVTKSDAGDEEAKKMLTDPAFAEKIITQAQQQGEANKQEEQPVTEALERFRANMSAKLGGGNPIDRRYDLLLSDINGHLWEIDKDSKLLNVEPEEVNEFIREIIKIEPKVDKQGKFLQKIGYGIGRGIGTSAFAAPFAIAVSYLAPSIGIYGLTAKALAGVLASGGRTATLLNNTQLSTKEKIGEVLKVALAAFGQTHANAAPSAPTNGSQVQPGIHKPHNPLADEYNSAHQTKINTSGLGGAAHAAIPDPTNSIIKDWPRLSKTVLGRMTNAGGVARGVSSVDEGALKAIIAKLKQDGLDWNTMSMAKKARIFDPIVAKFLHK